MTPMVANVAALPMTKPCRETDIERDPLLFYAELRFGRWAFAWSGRKPDNAVLREASHVLRVDSEFPVQDLGGVGADRRRAGRQARHPRVGEARKRVISGPRPEVGIGKSHQRAARDDLRILEDRIDRFERSDGAARAIEDRDDFVARALRTESVDQRVERFAVANAVGIRAKARIGEQLVAADRLQHSLRDRLRTSRERVGRYV